MYLPLVALSFVASLALVDGYPITGSVVNCRSGPGTQHAIVKSYKKGHDVKITCQAPGTNVKGDAIWDKTSDGCYVADYYVRTGTSGYVTKHCSSGGGGGGSGNLPGLNPTQSKHARAIIGEAKKEGVGRHGCTAGIATAIVESNILIYANRKVPKSLKYAHDAIGSDHDSIGIFQQRAMYYPNIAADMDAARSAGQFFSKMKHVSGWKSMAVGKLCQKVQGSAYPTRYSQHVTAASKICAAGGL